jgi:hypothetical protein
VVIKKGTREMKELEKSHLVSRSKIVNHPSYSEPMLMVQYGWTDRYKTIWNKEFELKKAGEK